MDEELHRNPWKVPRQALQLGFLTLLVVLTSQNLPAQSTPRQLGPILGRSLMDPVAARYQLQQYLMGKVSPLPDDSGLGREGWLKLGKEIRARVLNEVIFHGWPRDWVDSPPRFEDLGFVDSGPGYRIRKLRYEIVPNFSSVALLYEPDPLPAGAPAILNVNGHVGAAGKSVEYKQKRCINFAKRGILALNLEWLAFGELSHPENSHWYGAHLDLVGANAAGLFYLAMRRGLDYLAEHSSVDSTRLGVTGLSGGGWQTIVLSSLDERVQVAVPVAGYSSLVSRIERPGDIGDIEQNATDLLVGQDYSHLTALRAPRPTLLVYNVEDDCCFRAPLVKPYIYDAIKPFFRLMGQPDLLAWHENSDPGDHNYQQENRIEGYRFFEAHFGLPESSTEIPAEHEIKSFEELEVGIPASNLTILSLARRLSERGSRLRESVASRADRADEERLRLGRLIRYEPVSVHHAWAITNSREKGVDSASFRFEFDNRLSATGVVLQIQGKAAHGPGRPVIVLSDEGRESASAIVSDRVNRGDRVLAANLLFMGDANPEDRRGFVQLLSTTGDRALGIQVAQLIALTGWMGEGHRSQVRLECDGLRSQVIAQLAAALMPERFSEIILRHGTRSLGYLLAEPVEFEQAPELFCLDLYRDFDLPQLTQLAAPVRVFLPEDRSGR